MTTSAPLPGSRRRLGSAAHRFSCRLSVLPKVSGRSQALLARLSSKYFLMAAWLEPLRSLRSAMQVATICAPRAAQLTPPASPARGCTLRCPQP